MSSSLSLVKSWSWQHAVATRHRTSFPAPKIQVSNSTAMVHLNHTGNSHPVVRTAVRPSVKWVYKRCTRRLVQLLKDFSLASPENRQRLRNANRKHREKRVDTG